MKNKFLQNNINRLNIFFLSIFIINSSTNVNTNTNQIKFEILTGTGYYVGDLNKLHFNNLRVAEGVTFVRTLTEDFF